MNKFIFTLVLLLSFSFAENNNLAEEDIYYSQLDKEGGEGVFLAAHPNHKKNKSPLRKRYYKRKRKVRNPAQGK